MAHVLCGIACSAVRVRPLHEFDVDHVAGTMAFGVGGTKLGSKLLEALWTGMDCCDTAIALFGEVLVLDGGLLAEEGGGGAADEAEEDKHCCTKSKQQSPCTMHPLSQKHVLL